MTDRLIVVGTILFAGLYLFATSKISSSIVGDVIGPKVFPNLLAIALILAALLLSAELIHTKGGSTEKKKELKEQGKYLLLVGAVGCWTLIYIVILEPLGYLISSTLYLLVLMSFFNRKKHRMNVMVSIMFTVGVYVFFTKVIGIALARGLLPF